MEPVRTPTDPKQVYVWDRFVRFFHWALVASFVVAFLTEDDVLTLHVWAGYIAGALILLRLPWGLVGPRYARFSDFAYGPRAALAYLGALLSFRAKRYLGHSPAGGLMAFALMAVIAATVLTGLAADNVGRPGKGGGVLGELHEVLANLALILVLAHVAGVAVSSLIHRENLIRAMVTGWKRAE